MSDDEVIIESSAVERYKTPKPDLSTAAEVFVPTLFQTRYIVRFAYGIADTYAHGRATETLTDHPDFFLSYEDADEWGKRHCPVGLAYGITKLFARVSESEIAKYAADESDED
jgi:hypothetical protein